MLERWKHDLTELDLAPCEAPIWARGAHAQTILGAYLPTPPMPNHGQVQIIPLEDEEALHTTWFPGSQNRVVLYLFHGLSGHAEAVYMRLSAHMALKRGYHVVAVNHRGCGTGRGLALKPYHSGRAEDLAAVIAHGRRTHPNLIHIAVGFSLSGNALLLLAAGERGHDPPDLAIAVNAPIQLEKAALNLKRGLNKVYDLRFTMRLRQTVYQRMADGLPERYHIPAWCSLHDFDNHYTAPAAGFRDREDYYRRCSAAAHVARIAVPTIVLTAKDDPMVDWRDYLAAPFSPWAHLHFEEHGGHLAYLNRSKHGRRWLAYFLDEVIGRSLPALEAHKQTAFDKICNVP